GPIRSLIRNALGLALALLAACTPAPLGEAPSAPPPAAAAPREKVISIVARRYEFTPASVTLKRGEPVVLELTSFDRWHGFFIPELKLRADAMPDETARLRIVPDRVGSFGFHCDVFCGAGHGGMEGVIIVTE
ncbi:MAG: cupredoxin domain-containing protein, partial [Alphaproteobacteria bacterium]|nr:cupredoxin domain-containing protein [Alphaproteobacteria bacterium]